MTLPNIIRRERGINWQGLMFRYNLLPPKRRMTDEDVLALGWLDKIVLDDADWFTGVPATDLAIAILDELYERRTGNDAG